MSRVVKKIRPPVSQRYVDEIGAPLKAKKAWDGQDKDAFFRDKFAHVHAKQAKNRAAGGAKSAGAKSAKSAESKPLPNPKFAQKFKETRAKNPTTDYLFGKNPVAAALESRKVFKVFTGNKYNDIDVGILQKCSAMNIPLQANTPLQHLEEMASRGVHNNYVAAVSQREYLELQDLKVQEHQLSVGDEELQLTSKWPLGVYVDQVTDTHNMGAVLRCAYYLGADFVAFSKRNCAPISPQVIKASAGAAEFLPVFTVNSPLQLLDILREESWNVIATLPKTKATDLISVHPNELHALRDKPCLVLIGSEDKGLRTSLAQRSTHSTCLEPSRENQLIDSLNVSVATALLLEKLRVE